MGIMRAGPTCYSNLSERRQIKAMAALGRHAWQARCQVGSGQQPVRSVGSDRLSLFVLSTLATMVLGGCRYACHDCQSVFKAMAGLTDRADCVGWMEWYPIPSHPRTWCTWLLVGTSSKFAGWLGRVSVSASPVSVVAVAPEGLPAREHLESQPASQPANQCAAHTPPPTTMTLQVDWKYVR